MTHDAACSCHPGVLDPEVLEGLKSLEGDDPAGMAAIVERFLEETRSRLDALRATRGEAQAVARMTHALRGSCATFAASEMASLCGRLEEASAAPGFRLTEATLARLDHEYGRVATALGAVFRLPGR